MADELGSRRLSRRTFLAALGAVTGGWALGAPTHAQPRSTVVLARAEGPGAPGYDRILELVTAAVRRLTGEATDAAARRRFFGLRDTLAVQIAASPVPVTPEVVDALCTTAARAGVAEERMLVYSADEQELYQAGFAIRHEGPGVRCYGAGSGEYQESLTRLLGPEVTALANVPCLSPHPAVGLAGAIANYLNAAANGLRHDALSDGGGRVPQILKLRPCRDRTRLHVMDCLEPAYDLPVGAPPARWRYNGILLSTDAVALDSVALAILQGKRREVTGRDWPLDPFPSHIQRAAEQYGLGVADLESIELRRVGPMDAALI
ncbi:MAG: DUF362 domain-containing protein [Armatimonadetes bacterium]|nr:DUF362 domain-containing protein [Armatimonadota bacterium]